MNNNNRYRTRILEHKLVPEDGIDFVSSDKHGAIILFHGVTRDHTDQRKVLYLEYEAYLPMAQKKLDEVAMEMCRKWDVRVSIDHRIGKVEIRESSLVVAVGSSHRQEAYEASEFSVNMLKETVPIWKKEYFKGGEVWIGDEKGFRPLS